MRKLKNFLWEDEAVTAMEYGLILGLLAAIIFTGVTFFYQGLDNLFRAWGNWYSGRTMSTP